MRIGSNRRIRCYDRQGREIAALYEQCDYSKAMREIMTLRIKRISLLLRKHRGRSSSKMKPGTSPSGL